MYVVDWLSMFDLLTCSRKRNVRRNRDGIRSEIKVKDFQQE
jgi:hypothetical protein